MWDRKTCVRDAAHRGLHDESRGVIENTWPAFEAAIKAGVAIECDVQRTRDDVPLVFHDFTLDRLTQGTGHVADFEHTQIREFAYKKTDETILSLAELLRRVAGRAPILVELKSEWSAPPLHWLQSICDLSQSYRGAIALMSFDPDLMRTVRKIAPDVARGLVSGRYRHPDRVPWYPDVISSQRAEALSNLCDIDTVKPDFIAYHVKDLDYAAVRNARQNYELPIFTWTVRGNDDWKLANTYADAAIFEGTPR